MGSILIREYEPQDRTSCIELLKRSFPGTSDEKSFQWRFETEKSYHPLLVCAMDNGTVVSFCSWIPWEFSYDNNHYIGYQAGEAATDVKYRRRGLFSRLLHYGEEIALERGAAFLFAFPSEKGLSYTPISNAGYVCTGHNFFRLRPVNPFLKSSEEHAGLDTKLEYTSMLIQSNLFTPVFNHSYCRWRFLQNPMTYNIIRFTQDNVSAFFVIRKKKWRKISEVLLLDCQFGTYDNLFISRAFNHLSRICSREALYIRTFFNKYSDKGMALEKHFSFSVKSKSHPLLVKPLSAKIDHRSLYDLNYWDIMPHCIDDL